MDVVRNLLRGRKAEDDTSKTYDVSMPLTMPFTQSIHLSYSNLQGRKRAEARGDDPGGDIMLHGQKNGRG